MVGYWMLGGTLSKLSFAVGMVVGWGGDLLSREDP